jgi:hypothetical protein
MQIMFDSNAKSNKEIEATVKKFLEEVDTAEKAKNVPIIIHQDGVKKSYYIRCAISAETMKEVISLDARLDPESDDTFRDNREVQETNNTFLRMKMDAEGEREFNDIIAEYITSYEPDKPLKVWGGQHRSRAVMDALNEKKISRYHGFRIYFGLNKEQRNELALISNTSIAASNDLFDRQLEETYMGPHLRKWCVTVGLLKKGEDFPDTGSHSERITTQLARSFVVNYFKGKEAGKQLTEDQLDRNIYEPYLPKTGIFLDEEYTGLTEAKGEKLWTDKGLITAGKAFAKLHKAQYEAIRKSKTDFKVYRMKALVPSVLSSWAYVAGLLDSHTKRLEVHLTIPEPPKGVPDPLNAEEMYKYRYYQDIEGSHGLGTKAVTKDRQRMAQVFLARSMDPAATLNKKLLDQAINQVTALRFFSRGYMA